MSELDDLDLEHELGLDSNANSKGIQLSKSDEEAILHELDLDIDLNDLNTLSPVSNGKANDTMTTSAEVSVLSSPTMTSNRENDLKDLQKEQFSPTASSSRKTEIMTSTASPEKIRSETIESAMPSKPALKVLSDLSAAVPTVDLTVSEQQEDAEDAVVMSVTTAAPSVHTTVDSPQEIVVEETNQTRSRTNDNDEDSNRVPAQQVDQDIEEPTQKFEVASDVSDDVSEDEDMELHMTVPGPVHDRVRTAAAYEDGVDAPDTTGHRKMSLEDTHTLEVGNNEQFHLASSAAETAFDYLDAQKLLLDGEHLQWSNVYHNPAPKFSLTSWPVIGVLVAATLAPSVVVLGFRAGLHWSNIVFLVVSVLVAAWLGYQIAQRIRQYRQPSIHIGLITNKRSILCIIEGNLYHVHSLQHTRLKNIEAMRWEKDSSITFFSKSPEQDHGRDVAAFAFLLNSQHELDSAIKLLMELSAAIDVPISAFERNSDYKDEKHVDFLSAELTAPTPSDMTPILLNPALYPWAPSTLSTDENVLWFYPPNFLSRWKTNRASFLLCLFVAFGIPAIILLAPHIPAYFPLVAGIACILILLLRNTLSVVYLVTDQRVVKITQNFLSFLPYCDSRHYYNVQYIPYSHLYPFTITVQCPDSEGPHLLVDRELHMIGRAQPKNRAAFAIAATEEPQRTDTPVNASARIAQLAPLPRDPNQTHVIEVRGEVRPVSDATRENFSGTLNELRFPHKFYMHVPCIDILSVEHLLHIVHDRLYKRKKAVSALRRGLDTDAVSEIDDDYGFEHHPSENTGVRSSVTGHDHDTLLQRQEVEMRSDDL